MIESLVQAGVVSARQTQTLRQVHVLMPSLCRVRQGYKGIRWAGQALVAHTHHLILMPAGEVLEVTNHPVGDKYRAEVFSFSPALIARFRAWHPAAFDVQQATAGAGLCVPLDPHTEQAWERLLTSQASDAPVPLIEHDAEAVLLALSLAGHAGLLLMDRRDPLSARVQQIMLLDPAKDWSVALVAERLHMGASTLRRQLALEGRSFREIVESVRLGTALNLLQTTKRPIAEIAEASGYASASRFAVRFRQCYGLSPSALRASI
ncbi:helix-turn-helix transcriptional regulator [Chitinimonas naiadis]